MQHNDNHSSNLMIPIENILDCYAIYSAVRDENGIIVDFMTEYVNDAACVCNRMTREEQVGKTLLELLPTHKKSGLFEEYCKVVETGKTLFKEGFSYIDHFSKQELSIVVDIMAIKYGDGYAANWRDITENIKMEKALIESEARFKSAFEYSAVGMALLKPNLEPIKVNKALCDILGYNETEFMNLTFEKYLHKDDVNKVLLCMQKLIDGKVSSFQTEIRCINKNGHIIWVILNISEVRLEDREIVYYIAQGQDITLIKQANEALEYDKLKTEFFANISHELRTPIHIILNALKIVDIKIENSLPMINKIDVLKYIKMIKQNCNRLIRLINNLIDATKIDSGFYNINLKNYNIVKVVEDITQSVSGYIRMKGLKLQFDTSIEEKIIACDADKIERIMLNLLSNAVKFSRSKGTIKVHLHNEDGYVIISVKDNGIGIKKEKLSEVFERFRQVDKSLTRNHEGSGIGLSIVKSLAELHGGTASVESRSGHGSKFIIRLPDKKLKDETVINKNGESLIKDNVEKINVEFSDIYLDENV